MPIKPLIALPSFGGLVRVSAGGPKPTNTVAPSITGTPKQNSTLAAFAGTWSNGPSTFAYQWQASADGATGWADIAGATAATYTAQVGDVDQYLRVSVTATNANGSATVSTAAVGPVEEISIRDGLVAEYLFASGNELADTSGNGYDLTSFGATFSNGIAAFDGASYLAAALPSTFVNFSVSFWANLAVQTAGYSALFFLWTDLGGSESFGYMGLYTNPPATDGTLSVYNGSTIGWLPPSGVNVCDSEWHHIAAVVSSGTLTLYIDGVSTINTSIDTTETYGGNLVIGTNFFGDFIAGSVSKFRVHNRSLIGSEISALIGEGY